MGTGALTPRLIALVGEKWSCSISVFLQVACISSAQKESITGLQAEVAHLSSKAASEAARLAAEGASEAAARAQREAAMEELASAQKESLAGLQAEVARLAAGGPPEATLNSGP